ncbi:MAG: hypothetical protein M1824_005714 [Vezdaea acicularis]|nr:MAG: hypothetical protein M1824_005714 [Vezdaea acicularis]
MPLPNVWHLRRVAEASAKACDICYKPTTSVLITVDNKDFFYTCQGHLKDRGFCSPIVSDEEIAARKKEELDREVAKLKMEFDEKQKKKKEKEKQKKEKDRKDGEKDKKDDASKESEEAKDAEKASTDKADKESPELADGIKSTSNVEEPRVYALQKFVITLNADKVCRLLTRGQPQKLLPNETG